MSKSPFAFLTAWLRRPPTALSQAAAGAPLLKRSPPVTPEQPLAGLGMGARRPMISATGALAGFEFYLDAGLLSRLRASDALVKKTYAANMVGAMRLCTAQQLKAVAILPLDWLFELPDDQFLPGMYFILDGNQALLDQTVLLPLMARLRRQGVLFGWCPSTAESLATELGRPDFISLAAPAAPTVAAWSLALQKSAAEWPALPHMLLDLPTVEVLEAVLRPPLVLAACALATSGATGRVQALLPQAQRLLHLLSLLVRDGESKLLVADIKTDTALSLRLLHHLNSAGASPGRQLESIEDAVSVLGRRALYAWVAHMLVHLAPPRPATQYLQALALARARLLELLAQAVGEPNPGALYLLGLASMLPQLLQCSLAEAVSSLPLPPQAIAALCEQSGPWQAYLALAQALEQGDMPAAEALAGPFGGLPAVLTYSVEVWRLS